MQAMDKTMVVEAAALARTGHAVSIVATNPKHLAELVRECEKLSRPFDRETMRITVGGGHIQFVIATRILTHTRYVLNSAEADSVGVMFAPTVTLPAGVKSISDLAKKAMAHLERGKAGRLVIDEGDATSHAPKKKTRKKKR